MFFRKIFLSFFLFSFLGFVKAQPLRVHGIITNTAFEPLPYASVEVKEEQLGKIANAKGEYEFTLKGGKYDLVFSLVGYQTHVITIVLDKNNLEQNVMLELSDKTTLKSVHISASKKDRAYEIIKNVIEHKDSFSLPSPNFSCDVYIKAFQQNEKNKSDSLQVNSFFSSKKIDSTKKKNIELDGMNMAEVALQLDFSYPNKIKETRIGVKKYGDTRRLFFLTTTDGDFNFYKNLIYSKPISTTPFLSPFSYSGLLAYRFKLLKSFDKNGHHFYRIKITAGKLGNALMNGEATIIDGLWAIQHLELEFPKYHLPEYDYFKVEQFFAIEKNKSLLQKQKFTYHTNNDDGKIVGSTMVNYSNYQLDKKFSKKYFGNEIGSTADLAYHQDSLFWKKNRSEPLQANEIKFIRHRDSLYQITHSSKYLDSVDKATNRINAGRILWNGLTFNNHYKEQTWNISPILSMLPNIFYVGGMRLGDYVGYQKRYANKKFINVYSNITYGLLNKDFKGTVYFQKMYNPYHRSFFSIELGHNFDLINFNDAYINLLQRGNFYQDNKIDITHSTELFNGFYLINELQFSMRSDLSNYKLANTLNGLVKNDSSVLTNQTIRTFQPYNAFYNRIEIDYTPQQKYLREPLQKIILGSKYPTFYTQWRKAIPDFFSSVENFDYIELGLRQRRTLGLASIFNFNFSAGKFLNTANLQLVDDKFMRRGDPFLFSNPLRNFQALDSTFAVYNWFYELHVLHEFNGAILNKIPLLKKLNLLEVAGGGLLDVPERNLRYAEAFVGLEKIFRIGIDKYKIGFYLVSSIANQAHQPIQYKIGIEQYNILKHSW